LSREHHEALLLSYRLKKGMEKGADLAAMASYARMMWESKLKSHFVFEELYLLPVLDRENSLVLRTLEEHRVLEKLLNNQLTEYSQLKEIADKLESHIRFEERSLYKAIQEAAGKETLLEIEKKSPSGPPCIVTDIFWK